MPTKPVATLTALCGILLSPAVRSEEAATVIPDTLTGNLSGIRELHETGVNPFATLTAETWANVSGGLRQGWWYNHLLDFGFQLDGEKLGACPGSSFFAQVHWAQNRRNDLSFADYTGASNPISGITAGNHLRVYNLYFRQSWRNDAVALKMGQLAADDDFMLSDYSRLFENSTLGALPSQVDMPSFPVFPVAAPGLHLSIRPAERLVFQTGLYYGRPGHDVSTNHGFGWVDEPDPSLAVFYEFGYDYKLAGRDARLKLGGTYHSGEVQDFKAFNDGHPELKDHGVYSFYAIHDVVLASRAGGEPLLGMFVRAGVKPKFDHSIVGAYGDTGLNWFGPMPGRPNDVTGVAYAYTAFGKEYRDSTGPDGVASSESTLALAYKAQITRYFSLQGSIQFLFNPAVSPETGKRETATVLGLRAQLQF